MGGSTKGPLDVSAVLTDPNVVALFGAHGGVILKRLQYGFWEAHSQYVPDGRGAWALNASWRVLAWMFTRTDAIEIVTRCPHLPSKALAKALGMTRDFTAARGWVSDGAIAAADIYRMTLQDWMRTAPGLEARGQWFHDRLGQEMARHNASREQHPDDDVHDRYVGAACDMIMAGNVLKGVSSYNRFAVMAGYLPIKPLSLRPVLIDIGNAVLKVSDGDFTVEAVAPTQ
jgi:hypothetical protein